MSNHVNTLGQQIGLPLPHWTPRQKPSNTIIEGLYCRLEPLNCEQHSEDLWQAFSADKEDFEKALKSIMPCAKDVPATSSECADYSVDVQRSSDSTWGATTSRQRDWAITLLSSTDDGYYSHTIPEVYTPQEYVSLGGDVPYYVISD